MIGPLLTQGKGVKRDVKREAQGQAVALISRRRCCGSWFALGCRGTFCGLGNDLKNFFSVMTDVFGVISLPRSLDAFQNRQCDE